MPDCVDGNSHGVVDHDRCIARRRPQLGSATWTELLVELEGLIADLVVHRAAFLVLSVPGPDGLFAQLAVLSDGGVEAEAVSTATRPCRSAGCPEVRHLLTADEQDGLRALGWRDPNPHRLNFHRASEPGWLWVAPLFSELLVRTLAEPFGATSPVVLTLSTGRLAPGFPARPGSRAA